MAKSYTNYDLRENKEEAIFQARERTLSGSVMKSSTGGAHHGDLANSQYGASADSKSGKSINSKTRKVLVSKDEAGEDPSPEVLEKRKRVDTKYFIGYFHYFWNKFGFFSACRKFFGSWLLRSTWERCLSAIGFSIGYFLSKKVLVPEIGLQDFLVRDKAW